MSEVWKKNKLKYYRELSGLTQQELAKLLNISQPALQRWEMGIREPNLTNLKDLCRILNIKVSDIVNLD